MNRIPKHPFPARALATAGVAISLLPAWSCAANAVDAGTYPKAIQVAVARGVDVVRSFKAASSLTGWVLSQDGRPSIVYTTADGKTLLVGELIDENGRPLTQQYAAEYLPQPDRSAAFAQLDKVNAIVEGPRDHPKSVLYAFFDANCPFCHYTWQALQPYEKAGLQVRWIPVAVLGETSLPEALAIMSADDRLLAFRAMQQQYRMGAPLAAGQKPQTNPKLAEQIHANAELMQAFGIEGTPGIVWKDRDGKIRIKSGMPRLSEIPAMTGLQEQAVNDPGLQKFR